MDEVAVLRSFNRWYTRRIGVLGEFYLGTGRPLGPARLLFEIGTEGARVAELRRRLDLDSGYLSRLLRQLEHEGLATVAPDTEDGRQRTVHLTPSGRRERERFDQTSEEFGRRLIGPLSERQRATLASSLATAERLLRAAAVEIDVADPCSPAAQSVLRQYFAELDHRFPTGFDPGDDHAASSALSPPDGTFLIVLSDDEAPIGCGGIQRIDAITGEVKRMWVHPGWRGLGLGGRLLARLEDAARELGYARVVLDTNETLVEAIATYRRAGYRAAERYNDNPYAQHWFTKNL